MRWVKPFIFLIMASSAFGQYIDPREKANLDYYYDSKTNAIDGSRIITNSLPLTALSTLNFWIRVDGSNVMQSTLNLGSNRIINVQDPTGSLDAINKQWLDAATNAIYQYGTSNWLDSLSGVILSEGLSNAAWLDTNVLYIVVRTNYSSGVTGVGYLASNQIWTATNTFETNVIVQSIQFSGGTGTQGTVTWNNDEETLDIVCNGAVLQVGQETFYHVKNQSGADITNGSSICAVGTLGSSGRILVDLYIADGSIAPRYFLGMATEDIENGGDGKVTRFGKVRGIDLDDPRFDNAQEGALLFPSTTTRGYWQTNEPDTAYISLPSGLVITNGPQGTVMVRAQNHDENQSHRDIAAATNALWAAATNWVDTYYYPRSNPSNYITTAGEQDQVFTNWLDTNLVLYATNTLQEVTDAGSTTTNAITMNRGYRSGTNDYVSNELMAYDGVLELIESLISTVLYGATNAHPVISGASLWDDVPPQWTNTTVLAQYTNLIGTFYYTNYVSFIPAGQYGAHFHASVALNNAVECWGRLVISDGSSTSLLALSSSVDITTAEQEFDIFMNQTTNVYPATGWYVGIAFYANKPGVPANTLYVEGGTNHLTHLSTPSLNAAVDNTAYIARDGSQPPTTNISFGNFRITDLANPVNAQDAVTKAYGDANYVTEGTSPTITNFDYKVNFAGYPRVTLSTNMITSSVSADTPIDINSFTNAFDDNFDTETSVGTWNADAHAYQIDLGATYSGYIMVSGVLSNNNANAVTYFKIGSGGSGATMTAGILKGGWWSNLRSQSVADSTFANNQSLGATTNISVQYFDGRYVYIVGDNSTAYACSYRFKEIIVWGTTNGWKTIAGTEPL